MCAPAACDCSGRGTRQMGLTPYQVSRRVVLLGAVAAGLAACPGTKPPAPAPAAPAAPAATTPAPSPSPTTKPAPPVDTRPRWPLTGELLKHKKDAQHAAVA